MKSLNDYIPGMEQSKQVTLVNRPGFLEAWSCEGWLPGEQHRSATFLVVYRSPLVKDTTAMYRPVLEKILAAHRVEVIRAGVYKDPAVMMGRGEILFIRLSDEGSDPPYTVDQMDDMLGAIVV